MPLSLASDRVVARFIAYIDDLGVRHRRIERALGMNDLETKRRRAQWEIAAFRFKVVLVYWAAWQRKAGFDPNQPRDGIGRWTDGSGDTPGIGHNSSVPWPKGHHFVDRELFDDKRLNLQPETRKVFEQAVTGPLHAGPHQWSREHRIYNDAVAEHFRSFLKENGITSDQMTPDQARKFVDHIKQTNDVRIRDFNLRIYRREIMYWFRRLPRAND